MHATQQLQQKPRISTFCHTATWPYSATRNALLCTIPRALLRPSGVLATQLPSRSMDAPTTRRLSSERSPVTATKSPCAKVPYSS